MKTFNIMMYYLSKFIVSSFLMITVLNLYRERWVMTDEGAYLLGYAMPQALDSIFTFCFIIGIPFVVFSEKPK